MPMLTHRRRFPWITTAERATKFIICSRNPYHLVPNLVRVHSASPPQGLLRPRPIEKASIDECFIDFTRPVREELIRRYPHLAQVPSSGADTPLPPPSVPVTWNTSANLVPIRPKDVTDNTDEPGASPRIAPEPEEPPITWHDIALSIAVEMMQSARDQVRTKLGYSTSAVCTLALQVLYRASHVLFVPGHCKE